MNSQKRFIAVPIWVCWSLAIGLVGCDQMSGPSLRGSGVAKTETRVVAPFSEIDVGSAIQLDAKIGPATSLVVTSDDNILPHVKTVVAGDRLKIYLDGSCSTNIGIKVEATTPALQALLGSGASKSTVSGITGEQFQLGLSGASGCQLTGDADLIDATLSGASHGTIVGTARQLTVECSGASHLDATRLTARMVAAELSGASTANVNATDELTAVASGASTLRYVGQPAKLDKAISGASTVASQ
jgi:putative autotransporter adhesin-like protein